MRSGPNRDHSQPRQARGHDPFYVFARRANLSHASSTCTVGQIKFTFPRVRAWSEGRFAIVTKRWAGMRWTCRVAARSLVAPTNNLDTDGEIVWSWPPGAEAKFATRQACRRRGQERRAPRRSRISP